MAKTTLRRYKPPRMLRKLAGLFPHSLPVGRQAFDQFCKDLFDTYGLPDHPSYKNAVATMVMHLPPTVSKKSKRFFAESIKKSMANQIAYSVIQEIREAEKQAKAKEEKKSTPVLDVVSSLANERSQG